MQYREMRHLWCYFALMNNAGDKFGVCGMIA